MKRGQHQKRDVPENRCCRETRRIVIGSGPDPVAGGRAARCGTAGKDLDNDHAAAAARAWRTMIGGGVRIGGVVHCRRINLRHWSGHQLPGARDVGLAAGAGEGRGGWGGGGGGGGGEGGRGGESGTRGGGKGGGGRARAAGRGCSFVF